MLGVTVLLCLSASVVWSETMDDLVKRNGVYYKKFSNIPFSGTVKSIVDHKWEFTHLFLKEKRLIKGKIEKGMKVGLWETYIAESEHTKSIGNEKVGQLVESGNYKNGNKDGIWLIYSGTFLSQKIPYKNGKKEGKGLGYYEDGNLKSELNFKNNKKEGKGLGYYKDGNLKSKLNFKNNKKEGVFKYFYPSGILSEIINFKNDLMTGTHKLYHKNGNIKKIKKYKIENGIVYCDADDKIFDLDGKFVREQKGC